MASIKSNIYDIIKRPLITEKSGVIRAESNSFVFEVHPKANKIEIGNAISKLFNVKVLCVKTLNYKGKVKRVGTKLGKRKDWKKAYVTLKKGDKLEIVDGL